MEQPNPVVLLSDEVWHIVDHSRRAKSGLCGRQLGRRQAHSRLRTVGIEHICPRCRQLFATGLPDSQTPR